jgi:uncharacterized protein YeeX (DUF496 family)
VTYPHRDGEQILGLDRDLHAACDAALSGEVEDNQRLTRNLADQQARDALILRLLNYIGPDDTEKTLRAAIIHTQQLLAGARRHQAHIRALARLADEQRERLDQLTVAELADTKPDDAA